MTKPNEPAYPVEYDNQSDADFQGLTKREYFAAMAMQGLCSEQAFHKWMRSEYAVESVAIADALISELNKEKP